MKKLTRTSLGKLAVPIGLVVGLAACGATDASEDMSAMHQSPAQPGAEPTASAEESKAAEPHGTVALIGAALEKVCLDDDQRAAIEKLGPPVLEKEQKVAEARHAFRKALVEQFKSGDIDECALESDIDALVKAREEASPVMRKALEDLHGILKPRQRKVLADTVQGWMKELAASGKTFAAEVAKDLGLSEEQKAQFREAMEKSRPQLEEERNLANAIFEAFKQDQFSIEAISPLAKVGEKTRARAEAMIDRAREVLSILTPEQRDKLVEKIAAKKEAKEEANKEEGRKGEKVKGEEEEEEEEEEEQGPKQTPRQAPQLGPQQQQQQIPEQQMQAPPAQEPIGTVQEGLVVRGGGFRAGGVRGWGGGAYRAGGYRVGYGGAYGGGYAVRRGYATGGAFVGGYGPGIW